MIPESIAAKGFSVLVALKSKDKPDPLETPVKSFDCSLYFFYLINLKESANVQHNIYRAVPEDLLRGLSEI